ncbi:MAG: hypothetical protein GFH27_549283n25 [Chloroflexi bacterium AL-W]|nr:hypothetical protein [Chloroflexi bacterium AL-N1]NOK64855.1 hypothetical protein [Chloroflexi bacterium AL-N10]NOK76625.1 hypothetical protein [Chloroflexi bacterium AL-N5]NOK80146.1 hypothetical protein [Chloroflexi bacterium AL-W]NOK86659.1 hypothetical protein [Chloroflexi bacterium AL-N15]
MTHYLPQNHQGDADIIRIIDFVKTVRPSLCISEYPNACELPELLALPANQATTRLWSNNEGNLVGFAYVDVFQTLRFDLAWQLQDPALEQAILAWGQTCLDGKHPFLCATSHDADHQRLDFFERHQFTPQSDSIVHMMCSLDNVIPEPTLPSGFTIRPIAGEAEAETIADLHRTAFGTPHMTTE